MSKQERARMGQGGVVRAAAAAAMALSGMLPGRAAAADRFAVVGDFGNASTNELAVANAIKAINPNFVTTLGDNNYLNNGAPAGWDGAIGDFYHPFIRYAATGSGSKYAPGGSAAGSHTQPATNQFFPVLGNHDWDSSATGYTDYFDLPSLTPTPGNTERYYDVVKGNVHFFMLDSDSRETDGIGTTSTPHTQYDWFTSAIAASTSTWNIVQFHHPLYSSGAHGASGLNWDFKALGVDLVITGHEHDYERSNINGMPYLVAGNGGAELRLFDTPIAQSQVRLANMYGFLDVRADANTLGVQFKDVGGNVMDSFMLAASGVALIDRHIGTWTGATGTFGDGSKWAGGAAPVSGNNTALAFTGGSYTATQDAVGAFAANSLTFVNAGAVTVAPGASSSGLVINGTQAAINQQGNGATTISSRLNFTTDTTINVAAGAGQLKLDNAAQPDTYGAYIGSGNLTIDNRSANAVILGNADDSIISDDAATFTGNVNITAGTVKVARAGGGVWGDDTIVTVAAGATLDMNGNGETFGGIQGAGNVVTSTNGLFFVATGNRTFSGVVSGTGWIEQNNAGILTLSGANTYTGGTVVDQGTVKQGAANSVPKLSDVFMNGGTFDLGGFAADVGGLMGNAGSIVLGNATLTFGNNNQSRSNGSVISGTGNLVKVGTGTQTLTGSNTYTGSTTVNSGTLVLSGNGAIGPSNAIVVSPGATVKEDNTSTNGTVTANRIGSTASVTLNAGNFVFLGNNTAASSDVVGPLTLGAGTSTISISRGTTSGQVATLTFGTSATAASDISRTSGTGVANFNTAITGQGGPGGSTGGGDRIYLGGDAANPGATGKVASINTPAAWLVANGRDIARYSGSNGFQELSTTNGVSRSATFTTAANVLLTTAGASAAATGPVTVNSLVIQGTGSRSTAVTGTLTITNTGSGAFDASGGLVVGGGGDYALTGGSVTAGGAGAYQLYTWIDSGVTTINSGVVNNGANALQLIKSGAGTLVLGNSANAYSGGTVLNGGTLQVASAAYLGTGGVTLAGGTLKATGPINTSAPLTIAAPGGTLDTNGANTLSFTGANSGAGSLNVIGGGTLAVGAGLGTTGNVTLTGAGTTLKSTAGGDFLSDSTLLTLNANTVFDDTAGDGEQWGGLSGSGTVIGKAGAQIQFGLDQLDSTFSGQIRAGTAGVATAGAQLTRLTKSGVGTITLSNGASDFGGQVQVNNGTLAVTTLADDGQVSSIGTGATSGADLTMGTTTTVGTLRYTGGTVSTDRSILLNQGGGAIDVASSGATLTLTGGITDSGLIGTAGSLTKSGPGRLVLQGANNYLGATTINGGTLVAGQAQLSTTSSLAFNGGTFEASETIAVNAGVNVASAYGIIDTGANVVQFNGAVTGTGQLGKTGSGTLVLNGAGGGLTGDVIVRAGTLRTAGNNNALSDSTQLVLLPGTTWDDSYGDGEQLGGLSGYGDVLERKGGAFPLRFGENNRDTAFFGVIREGENGIVGAGSGSVSVVKAGTGRTTLGGANDYSGSTSVYNGVLALGAHDALPIGTTVTLGTPSAATAGVFDLGGFDQAVAGVSVSSGNTGGAANMIVNTCADRTSVLAVVAGSPQAFAGVVAGNLKLLKTGSSTLTLNGVNSYTGGTTVALGTLRLTPAARTPVLGAGEAGADVQNGSVVFEYTTGNNPAAAIRALLTAAYNTADGVTGVRMLTGQLRSSTATASRGLGYVDDGVSLVTVKATLYGDADLDGGVSINDFNNLAAAFGQASGKVWLDGDFDYDGGVSINDFNLLAANFGQTVPTASDGPNYAALALWDFAVANNDAAGFIAATGVPEPAGLGLLAGAAALGLRRRRKAC